MYKHTTYYCSKGWQKVRKGWAGEKFTLAADPVTVRCAPPAEPSPAAEKVASTPPDTASSLFRFLCHATCGTAAPFH